MSNVKKRVYDSEGRRAKAAQTRSHILVCARKLFETEGFEGMTMESLARAAHVSTPTVYALFQSKRGVLRALMDEALPSVQREALVEKVVQEKSLKARLKLAAKIARQMYDAERVQMDVFRGAALSAQNSEIWSKKGRKGVMRAKRKRRWKW